MSSAWDRSEVEPELVRRELDRIAGSEEFAGSERLSRFLRYVVEQTLAGQVDQLKEALLGISVFDRDPGYDPKADPIVRTEARRLRGKLEAFYARAGVTLECEILVPKGAYVAEFRARPKVVPMSGGRREAGPREAIPVMEGALASEPMPVAQLGPQVVPQPMAQPVAQPVAEVVPFPDPKRPWSQSWLAAVVVLVLGLGFMAWRGWRPEAKATDFYVQPLTSARGNFDLPSFSPDGNQVAVSYRESPNEPPQIYIVSAASGAMKQLTKNPEGARLAVWSPDGSRIAHFVGNDWIAVSTPLGEQRKVTNSRPDPLCWTPDGKYLLIGRDSPDGRALVKVPVDASEPEQAVVPASRERNPLSWAYAPNGKTLAMVLCLPNSCELVIRDLETGKETTLTHDNAAINGIAWFPDGESLAFSSFRRGRPTLWRQPVRGGEPLPLQGVPTEAVHPSIGRTKDGKTRLAFLVTYSTVNLWEFPLEMAKGKLGEPKPVSRSTFRTDMVDMSPDGKRLAFVSTRLGRREVFVSDRSGENPSRLVSSSTTTENVFSVSWSPDGQNLAYISSTDAGGQVFVVPAAGGVPCPLTQLGPFFDATWSPDGKEVWFVRGGKQMNAPGPPEGEVVGVAANACGGNSVPRVVMPLDKGVRRPRWVESEKRLYFEQGGDLIRRALPDGKAELVAQRLANGWWAVREAGTYYVRQSGKGPGQGLPWELCLRPKGEATERCFGGVPGILDVRGPSFAVSQDGSRVILGRVDESGSTVYLSTER